jgi:hypothetical protein
MGACIKPRKAAPHHLHMEIAAFHVGAIDVGDFDFTVLQRHPTSLDNRLSQPG